MIRTLITTIILGFIVLNHLSAQIPRGAGRGSNGGFGNNNGIDTAQGDVEIDTFKIFYYYPLSFYKEYGFRDSLLSNTLAEQDPARRKGLDYQNLGVYGSAGQALVYEGTFRQGLDIGLHQFDYNLMQADSLPFYRLERAFTNAEYDSGGDQANSRTFLQFGRNFAKGVNMTIEYRRISQLAERLQFQNQQTRNTSFAAGLNFQNASGRYKAYLVFLSNKSEQNENGGILEEPTESNGFSSPASAAVRSETGSTEYRWTTYQYTHFFSLRKPVEATPEPLQKRPPLRRPPTRQPQSRNPLDSNQTDSLRMGLPGLSVDSTRLDTLPIPDSLSAPNMDSTKLALKRIPPRPNPGPQKSGIFNKQEFLLGHSISYKNAIYKFFDEVTTSGDANYYAPFLLDDRGLRNFIDHNILENRIFLLTYKPEETGSSLPRQSRGLLELGITHKLHNVRQEPNDFTVNNLFLTARWHYLPTKFLRLETYGHLGVLDNIGDFRVEGKLNLKLGNLGELRAKFINQLSEPNLIQRQLLVSQQMVWNNAFSKVLETNIEASYAIPSAKFSVTGSYHLINNMVYFDTLATARQFRSPVNIAQLKVRKDFQYGKFHLDNQIVFQTSSEDFVRLPEIVGKHSIYYNDKWFREILDTRIGLDVRYTNAYRADAYHPIIGDFYQQNQQTIPFIPWVDAHLSIRITKFRAYVKLENVYNRLLRRDPNGAAPDSEIDFSNPENWTLYYSTAFHPVPQDAVSGFRLGVRWRFTD